MPTTTNTAQRDILKAQRAAKDAKRAAKRAREDRLYAIVDGVLDALPMPPTYVHPFAAYPNTLGGLAFHLQTTGDVKSWRDTTAQIMTAFPPCPLYRVRGTFLSFTPELDKRDAASVAQGSTTCEEIAPFTVTLSTHGEYAGRAEVAWYSDTPDGRVRVTVELSASPHEGANAAGFRYAWDYIVSAKGRSEKNGRSAHWPFAVVKCARYSVPRGQASPLQAWWPLSMGATESEGVLESPSAAFLRLTTPSE